MATAILAPSRHGGGTSARCLFCGRPATAANGFCARCYREGFHYVHHITGRSNGWDWTERNAALLDGWNAARSRRLLVSEISARTYAHPGTARPSATHPWKTYSENAART